MRPRAIIATAAVAAASLAALGTGAASAQAASTCTWGGTPAEPTGSVYYTGGQGPTNTPSSGPLPFVATGPLGGECSGKLTYRGISEAGTTCAFGGFEASARGLPGVVRAAGADVLGLVPALLYDKSGNVVGSENPQVLTSGTEESNLGFANCNTPEGFQKGSFSSVIELFG